MQDIALLGIYIIAFSFIHSLFAADFFKERVKNIFGEEAYLRYYRFFYVVLSFITLIPLIPLWFFKRIESGLLYSVPEPYNLVFHLIMLTGIAIAAIAGIQLNPMEHLGISQLLGIEKSKEEKKLIKTGVYSLCRHPMYFGGMLLLWFNPSMYKADFVLSFLFTAYFIFGAFLEEKRLLDEFGREYEIYRKEVPMLIPNPFKRKGGK